jgi:hypothetical protein
MTVQTHPGDVAAVLIDAAGTGGRGGR